ncbi:phosphotransferase [Actinosynnema sp. NPDC020468]|uniref:phosphotransferase n=1 Tax=Actinosynnema sp. NPDC020468 TaxID=3154488 RepID=UPI0033CE8935
MALTPSRAVSAALAVASSLDLPADDPVVLKDGSNVLVWLRPAPVVARVGGVTAFVREDVHAHFTRADSLSRYLASRGVPVVEPLGAPTRHGAHVVALASRVEKLEWTPTVSWFCGFLRDLHAELRDYPGALPARGPLDDVDACLDLLGRPADLVDRREGLVARWPDEQAQPLHGDPHPANVLMTPSGPVWNDFEDAWRGPVGWDVASAALHRSLDREAMFADYPAAPFWADLRTLLVDCWRAADDLYRTRTLPAG